MGNELAQAELDSDTLLKLATGDTSRLSAAQKVELIVQVCKASGLDPRLSPFEFIRFQGKEIMYARKNATDQLMRVHGIKLRILDQQNESGEIRVVTIEGSTIDGRATVDIGAVPIGGLKGDALANALMKAVTKAKRRTVLSLCGLSMLDESEVETMPGAQPVPVEVPPSKPPVTEQAPQKPIPAAPALDKGALARKARIEALQKRWGSTFTRKATMAIGKPLPERLSLLSLGDIAAIEEYAQAEDKEAAATSAGASPVELDLQNNGEEEDLP